MQCIIGWCIIYCILNRVVICTCICIPNKPFGPIWLYRNCLCMRWTHINFFCFTSHSIMILECSIYIFSCWTTIVNLVSYNKLFSNVSCSVWNCFRSAKEVCSVKYRIMVKQFNIQSRESGSIFINKSNI